MTLFDLAVGGAIALAVGNYASTMLCRLTDAALYHGRAWVRARMAARNAEKIAKQQLDERMQLVQEVLARSTDDPVRRAFMEAIEDPTEEHLGAFGQQVLILRLGARAMTFTPQQVEECGRDLLKAYEQHERLAVVATAERLVGGA